jgi:hypothetical protein
LNFLARALALPGVLAIGLIAPVSPAAADQPQTKVQEPGYSVKVFPQCGQAGVARRALRSLDSRPFARSLACGPEEIWGRAVYLSMENDADTSGDIEAFDPSTLESRIFVAADPESVVSSLAFSPRGSVFGNLLAGSRSYFVPPPLRIYFVSSYDPEGALGVGVSVPHPIFSVAFDPTGEFGGALYLSTAQGVQRFDPGGDVSPFAPVAGGTLRFGPGGDWGSDLYISGAGGVRISPGGAVSLFPGGFADFDWGAGPGFGSDMFSTCDAGHGELCRIHPDGSRSVWATGVAGPFAFCGDELWIYSSSGCERVTFVSRRD